MRKIILTAVCLLLLCSLTGCEAIERITGGKISLGGKSEGTEADYDGAYVYLLEADGESVTVRIENKSLSTWQSGNMRDYALEVERDGVWYVVEPTGDLANTMELMLFAPGEDVTHTFDILARYGRLPTGHYRIVKYFWANKTAFKDGQEFSLRCEFRVEES